MPWIFALTVRELAHPALRHSSTHRASTPTGVRPSTTPPPFAAAGPGPKARRGGCTTTSAYQPNGALPVEESPATTTGAAHRMALRWYSTSRRRFVWQRQDQQDESAPSVRRGAEIAPTQPDPWSAGPTGGCLAQIGEVPRFRRGHYAGSVINLVALILAPTSPVTSSKSGAFHIS